MSHWVITYASSSSDGQDASTSSGGTAPNARPKTVEVVKTGKTLLEQTTDETGNVVQIWRENGYQLFKDPANPNWFVGPAIDEHDPFGQPDYVTADFAGFDWISEKNFVGIQTISGLKCLVFKDKVLPISANEKNILTMEAFQNQRKADFSSRMVDAEADIDVDHLLPVSLKLGNITRLFTFDPNPPPPLDLPADAQAALTKYLKDNGL
jgi:hypothetical protein